ncbi:MAG: phosphate-selective porin, partial [Caulobacteraceae bacterium]|nr:phosphate-selective porin [Caulobacteraceae bacterium]
MRRSIFKSALLSAGGAAALLAFAAPASAQPADQAARLQALEDQVAALSSQIADLKASTSAATDDLSNRVNATTIALPNGKPSFATADGAFTANVRGVIQLDAAQYFQKDSLPASVTTGRDLNSGTNFRRFRIGLDGKLFRDFDYSILTDFGGAGVDGPGVIQEAYVQYNGWTLPGITVAGAPAPVRIRAGAFAPNLGLEDAASTSTAIFPERASPAEVARGLAGADKRIALQVGVNSDRWLVSAAATGAKAGDAATFDEQLGFVGRIAGTPVKAPGVLLHVGLNGSIVTQPAQTAAGAVRTITFSDRPELRVDGTQLVSSGALDATRASHVGAEFALQAKNFLLQSEVYRYHIDRRNPAVRDDDFYGWYAEGSYIFGATAGRKYNVTNGAFDAPTIAKNFSVKDGGLGALELAARYSVTDLDDHTRALPTINQVRGGKQTIASGQINWFLNPALRLGVTYYDVRVSRLTP